MVRKRQPTEKTMVKRLIAVSKETDERLKQLRQSEGISQWFFIRQAIEDALDRHESRTQV